MKPYRLLRNNKESGPYSADELIQMGLKAYDLVWADGKSAAWRYPSEIAELKPYAPAVEEQPFDRFYKKPASMAASQNEENTRNADVALSVDAIPSVVVKQVKPRIRIKADSKKIEIPVSQPQHRETFTQKEIVKPTEQETAQKQKETFQRETIKPVQTAASPDWKDMWLNWEQEKKAVNDASKVDVAGTMKSVNRYYSTVNEKSEPLETKFSQSLDDIKERYVETVLNQPRKKSSSSSSYLTATILIVAILGIGVWLGFKWSTRGGSSAQQKIVNTQPKSNETVKNEVNNASLQDNQNESAIVSAVKEENDPGEQTAHVIQVPVTKKTASQQSFEKKSVAAKTYTLNKTNVKPQQQKKSSNNDSYELSPFNNNVMVKKEVADNTTPSLTVKQDPHTSAISKFKKGAPKITDYITVNSSSSNNAAGGKLRVQNISDIPVDLVMIDLEYYDGNGRFEKGETVYVRNIGAGETVAIQAPDSRLAAKVGYKISMVSSEKNNLYLIAD